MSFLPTQLRAFLAVIEHGSLRGAAETLGVSPAAVSSSLTLLQRAVGVPLFARQGRRLALTPAGASFAKDARRIEALSASSIATARAAMERTRAPLRIGAVSAASEEFLGDLLAAFIKRSPAVPVELLAVTRDALWRMIERREVDIGFAEVPPPTGTLVFPAIRRNEYVVATGRRARHDRAALAKSLWLLREPGSGTRAATEDLLRDFGMTPPCRTIGSTAAIVRCVRAGVGVSLLSRDMIARDVQAGTIRIARTPFTPRPRPWHFIIAADRAPSRDMKLFLQVARETRTFAPAD